MAQKLLSHGTAIDYFSADYFLAKERFLAACARLGAEHHSLPIDAPSPTSAPLTIDVAVIGPENPQTALVASSGVHGVEGFFGSAVQLAFLEQLPPQWRPPDSGALVLIHAINPFGFAWQRRFNEDNVDLNRNFLRADEPYAGAPPLCGVFRNALMPSSSRLRIGTSASRIALLALRHGVRSFWETLPVGQYEFPDWLFFGGSDRAQSAHLVDSLLPTFLNSCREVVHLDFHTGLGRWADCKLLLSERDASENTTWWKQHFGGERVVTAAASARSYEIRGGFGSWLRDQFPQCQYRFATAEFGTYAPMRVIRALTDELHWHARLGHESLDHWARRRLTEAFAPSDPRWRTRTLGEGVALVRQAAGALWPSSDSPSGSFL